MAPFPDNSNASTPSVPAPLARPELSRYLRAKRGIDLVVAGSLLVLLWPLMRAIAWRIERDGTGPAYFIQQRVGEGGKSFGCVKFRTMRTDAEAVLARWRETNDPLWQSYRAHGNKLPHDPRVTAVGHWLRTTSLDELPQLLNVWRGEMSLVGPRPAFDHELVARTPSEQAAYLRTRPGITGLWQVSGRSNTGERERAALDVRYERERSLWTDLRILARTLPAVLRRDGAY